MKQVPKILETFDKETGRFGEGVWMSTDQNPMYALAVVYAADSPGNRYHKDAGLLDVIIQAGDCLIDHADARGQWVFTKKDGSMWLSNGWFPEDVAIRDLWRSSKDGRSWTRVSDNTPYDAYSRTLVYRDRIWAVSSSVMNGCGSSAASTTSIAAISETSGRRATGEAGSATNRRRSSRRGTP